MFVRGLKGQFVLLTNWGVLIPTSLQLGYLEYFSLETIKNMYKNVTFIGIFHGHHSVISCHFTLYFWRRYMIFLSGTLSKCS